MNNNIRTICILIVIHPILSFAHDINYDIDDIDEFIQNDNFTYEYQNPTCPVFDPIEKFNRKTHNINQKIDKILLKPSAKIYQKTLPTKFHRLVKSFFTNLQEPMSCVNYMLQKNLKNTVKTIMRFAINSTIGIGGLIDVAGRIGIQAPVQKFSDTLAFYGAKPGAYIVLPIIGGINARQIPDILAILFLNPIDLITSNTALYLSLQYTDLIVIRYDALNFTDYLDKKSLDHYIGMRNAIHNSIENKMNYPKNFMCK